MKTCPFLISDSIMNLTRWFLLIFSFPGRSQWGGTTFFPGRLSLEGASFCFGEGAQCGDTNQVCPLCWPEWTVEDPVCPCWAQHLPEQVWYWMFLLFLHCQTWYVFGVQIVIFIWRRSIVQDRLLVAADILFFFDSLRNRKDVNTVNTSADLPELFLHSHSSNSVAACYQHSLPTGPPYLFVY